MTFWNKRALHLSFYISEIRFLSILVFKEPKTGIDISKRKTRIGVSGKGNSKRAKDMSPHTC